MMARTRHKAVWFFVALFAIVIMVVFGQTSAHYRDRECQLEMDNAKLAEWLFLGIMKTEILKTLPGATYTVSSSGGASEHGGRFELTSIHDVVFDERAPAARLEEMVVALSANREIANWLSLAEEKKGTRFCRFHLEQGADKPCLRMLMHVSNHVNGLSQSDLDRLFSGDLVHPSPSPPQ
jgi:hypothetical protein